MGLIYDPKVENFLQRVKQPSAGKPGELDLVKLCHLLEDALLRKEETRKNLFETNKELENLAMKNAWLFQCPAFKVFIILQSSFLTYNIKCKNSFYVSDSDFSPLFSSASPCASLSLLAPSFSL